MVFKYQYTINGYVMPEGVVIAHVYTGQVNKPCTISIELPMSAKSTYSISNTATVLVQYGKTTATDMGYLFRGTIENIKEAGSSMLINCADKLLQLQQRTVNQVYRQIDNFGGHIHLILRDLIGTYGGLTANSSTVQSTDDTLILQEKYFCFDAYVYDKVKELCDVVQYIFYYDSNDDKVYAHEKGYYNNVDGFATGNNITTKPIWTKDSTNIISYLNLYGATYSAETVDYYEGDGTNNEFQLTYAVDTKKPTIKVEVYTDATGQWTEQLYGSVNAIGGTTPVYQYTFDADPSIRTVTFVTPPIVSTIEPENVRIIYSYLDTLYTTRSNDTCKGLYPASDGGYRYKKLTNTSIVTSTDLENIADTIIDYFSDTYDSVTFSATKITDFPHVGYSCSINDTMNNESRTLIITGFSFKYPADVYNIQLSEAYGDPNELLLTKEIRLKNLETASNANLQKVKESGINDVTINVDSDLIVSDFYVNNDIWESVINTSYNTVSFMTNQAYARASLSNIFDPTATGCSFSCWIKKNAISVPDQGYGEIILKISDVSNSYTLNIKSNNISYGNSNGSIISTNGELNNYDFTHIMVTHSSLGVANLYINNVLIKTGTFAQIAIDASESDVIYVGNTTSGPYYNSNIHGYIKDLRIFKKVISSIERTILYNSGSFTTNILGDEYHHFKLDETTGTTITDYGSEGVDLTGSNLTFITVTESIGSGVWDDSETWAINPSKDDFSTDMLLTKWGTTGVDAGWYVANGKLHYDDATGYTGESWLIWSLTNYEVHPNPEINVKIKKVDGHDVGVLFRCFNATPGNYYYIRYKDASHIEFGYVDINDPFTKIPIGEYDYVKPLGVWDTWKILVKGSNIVFKAGTSIDTLDTIFNITDTTVTDVSSPENRVVLFCNTDYEAYFDNFEVGRVIDMKVNE